MTADNNLLSEVEDAISHGSKARRTEALQQVTELFVRRAPVCSDEELDIFGDVIARLTVHIESAARAWLAARLATIPNAPRAVIRSLAFDDAIEVARPILTNSLRLDDPMLVENASTKSQLHLLAISKRRVLSEIVTDVLVERGDREVALSTAENAGARFSDAGFATLVRRSEQDDALTLCVGMRHDIPLNLFLKLLATASEAVRIKLEAENPNTRREAHEIVAEITTRMETDARKLVRDYSAAQIAMESRLKASPLTEQDLAFLAQHKRFEDSVVALAHLCEVSFELVDEAMIQEHPEMILIIAKAAGMSWSTTKALLRLREGKHRLSPRAIEQCLAGFERLKPATARQILLFHRARIKTVRPS